MYKKLRILSQYLKSIGFTKEGQEVEELSQEYSDDWHEEAVKEFGADPVSEEEYFEEHFSEKDLRDKYNFYSPWDIERDNEILKKHGAQIVRQDEDFVLGSGISGRVYSVIYNGKPAAAKVGTKLKDSWPMDYYEDSKKWKKIVESIELAPNAEKYIPEIYLLTGGVHEYLPTHPYWKSTAGEYEYDLVIMEQLKMLPHSLREYFEIPVDRMDRDEIKALESSKWDYERDFIKALQDLSEYVQWGDLHYNNIMVNSENQIKFIDPGQWHIKKAASLHPHIRYAILHIQEDLLPS